MSQCPLERNLARHIISSFSRMFLHEGSMNQPIEILFLFESKIGSYAFLKNNIMTVYAYTYGGFFCYNDTLSIFLFYKFSRDSVIALVSNSLIVKNYI